MVEVSSMEIMGTVDTSEIDRGFERVNDNFQMTRSQAESTNASFSRLGDITTSLGKSMTIIGAAGVGALTAIASSAPAVAPVMARLQNQFREISFELGQTLLPLFETFSDTIVPMLGGAAMDLANVVTGEFGQIDNLFGKGSGAAIGFAIGAKFGHPFLGAALGAAAGDKMQEVFTGTLDTIGSGFVDIFAGTDLIPDGLFENETSFQKAGRQLTNMLYRLFNMFNDKSLDIEYGGYTSVR